MTVMLDSFFGIHPFVVRSGLLVRMKPGEIKLYIYLMEESERLRTRLLVVTDGQIRKSVGTASRTLCNARKKLQELGLVSYRSVVGNRYEYTINNPKTGKPYPGDPRTPIVVPKRQRLQTPAYQPPVSSASHYSPAKIDNEPLEKHGVAGIFRKTGQRKFRRAGAERSLKKSPKPGSNEKGPRTLARRNLQSVSR